MPGQVSSRRVDDEGWWSKAGPMMYQVSSIGLAIRRPLRFTCKQSGPLAPQQSPAEQPEMCQHSKQKVIVPINCPAMPPAF